MSKEYTLAAFDPGERTGYVVVRVCPYFKPGSNADDGFLILDQGVLTVDEVGAKLKWLITKRDVVVYETWRLYADYAMQMIGNDMQPSQVVGMIRYATWLARREEVRAITLVAQGATVKKPAVKTMPDWLKAHMAKSSEQHDQDAIMHAWFYATKRYYANV